MTYARGHLYKLFGDYYNMLIQKFEYSPSYVVYSQCRSKAIIDTFNLPEILDIYGLIFTPETQQSLPTGSGTSNLR